MRGSVLAGHLTLDYPGGESRQVVGCEVALHGLGANAALAESMVDGVATIDDAVRKMRDDAKGTAKPTANRLAQAHRALAIVGSTLR